MKLTKSITNVLSSRAFCEALGPFFDMRNYYDDLIAWAKRTPYPADNITGPDFKEARNYYNVALYAMNAVDNKRYREAGTLVPLRTFAPFVAMGGKINSNIQIISNGKQSVAAYPDDWDSNVLADMLDVLTHLDSIMPVGDTLKHEYYANGVIENAGRVLAIRFEFHKAAECEVEEFPFSIGSTQKMYQHINSDFAVMDKLFKTTCLSDWKSSPYGTGNGFIDALKKSDLKALTMLDYLLFLSHIITTKTIAKPHNVGSFGMAVAGCGYYSKFTTNGAIDDAYWTRMASGGGHVYRRAVLKHVIAAASYSLR